MKRQRVVTQMVRSWHTVQRRVEKTSDGARDAVGATRPFSCVEVDGVSLTYNDSGSEKGFVIVCLHATGHGARDFEGTIRRLGNEHRIIALDWPAQGRSSNDTKPHSMQRYAELLEGFLDKLGITKCVLIGNSVGGGAAVLFAARHPGRVRGLVLENPAGLAPVDAPTGAVMRAVARAFAEGAKGAPWFPPVFAAYYRLILPLPAARAQRTRIIAAAVESAPALAAAWTSFAERAADLRSLVPAVTAPTLVLWAKSDRINVLARSRGAIDMFKHLRFIELPGGHAPHLEVPEAFEGAVRRFLSELDRHTN